MNDMTIGSFGGGGQPQTMSSREIAELTGKQHAHVMRDIRQMLAELHGEANVSKFGDIEKDGRNRDQPIFRLPKRESLILVSGYDLTMRAAIIDRWQELEAKTAAPALDMRDIGQLQIAALQLIEMNQEKDDKIAELTPKAQALDLIAASDETLTFTQASKVLGVKRETMTSWMNANGWIYRQNGSWVAYKRQIEAKRLTYKEANFVNERTGAREARPYCHLTQKGVTELATALPQGRA